VVFLVALRQIKSSCLIAWQIAAGPHQIALVSGPAKDHIFLSQNYSIGKSVW
jgi:hypothetical protein